MLQQTSIYINHKLLVSKKNKMQMAKLFHIVMIVMVMEGLITFNEARFCRQGLNIPCEQGKDYKCDSACRSQTLFPPRSFDTAVCESRVYNGKTVYYCLCVYDCFPPNDIKKSELSSEQV